MSPSELRKDVSDRESTLRENTADAAFLAQFYNGLENILKRISHFHNVSLPTGETWHVELFQRVSEPVYPGLPQLFDEELSLALAPYRRFRHVAFHSYGFQLDWNRMSGGINHIQDMYNKIENRLNMYLQSVDG